MMNKINDIIHDSIILSYRVDFVKNKILIYLLSYDNKRYVVNFSEVLTHKFDCILSDKSNIVFNITIKDINLFLEQNKYLLENLNNMSWPISYKNISELEKFLKSKNYKYIIISSSLGMDGWILAKTIDINKY